MNIQNVDEWEMVKLAGAPNLSRAPLNSLTSEAVSVGC